MVRIMEQNKGDMVWIMEQNIGDLAWIMNLNMGDFAGDYETEHGTLGIMQTSMCDNALWQS